MRARGIGAACFAVFGTLVAAFLGITAVLLVMDGLYLLAMLAWLTSGAYSVFAVLFGTLAWDSWLTAQQNRGESH